MKGWIAGLVSLRIALVATAGLAASSSSSTPPVQVVDANGKTVGQAFGNAEGSLISVLFKANGIWFDVPVSTSGFPADLGFSVFFPTSDCSGTAFVDIPADIPLAFGLFNANVPAIVQGGGGGLVYYPDVTKVQTVTLNSVATFFPDGTIRQCVQTGSSPQPSAAPITSTTMPVFTPPFSLH